MRHEGGGLDWVRFAEIWGGGTVGMRGLGSFCRNMERRDTWCAKIGFVLRKRVLLEVGCTVDWVRFAFFGS